MATLLPPPKRRKLNPGTAEPIPVPDEIVEAAPNVVVQFVNEEDGSVMAPAVQLPADLTREALESLVNKLTKTVNFSHFPQFFFSSLLCAFALQMEPY